MTQSDKTAQMKFRTTVIINFEEGGWESSVLNRVAQASWSMISTKRVHRTFLGICRGRQGKGVSLQGQTRAQYNYIGLHAITTIHATIKNSDRVVKNRDISR